MKCWNWALFTFNGEEDMNVNLSSNLIAKYNEITIDMDKVKQSISEQNVENPQKKDEIYISEEGKIALEENLSEFRGETVPHIKGKFSEISRQYYVDTFGEKLITSEKSKDMDAFFNKMKTLYHEMQVDIEAKYDNDKQEEVYCISRNGGIEALTKDKEMELLDYAYETHKMLMKNSMKIWEKGF